ncbi:MAG: TolC family protein [Thermoanaerobaculia bacterium]
MNDRLAAALLAAAAIVGPPLYALPVPEARSVTVREAVRLALERAPEIAVAEGAARAAAAAAEEAGSIRRPQLALNTSPGYSIGLPLSVAGEVPSAFGASVRMALYDAGHRSEELEALAQAAGAQGALEDARVDVVRRTVAACAKLRVDLTRAGGARTRLAARETMARRGRALWREGRLTELDAERAALEEARARQKLDAVLSDLDLDRYELARLLGLPPSTPLAVTQDPAEVLPEPAPGDAVAAALARDARLKALAGMAEALGKSAKLLSRTFQPRVNAEARYAYVPRGFGYEKYYLSYKENVASIGVAVVLPVLTGGREAAQAAQSRARLFRVEGERRVREEDLAQQVRRAQAAAESARLEAGLARRGVGLAQEALRQAPALSREGRGEADVVERALLALVDAEEDAARAAREQVLTRLALLTLEGALLPAFDVEPETAIRR